MLSIELAVNAFSAVAAAAAASCCDDDYPTLPSLMYQQNALTLVLTSIWQNIHASANISSLMSRISRPQQSDSDFWQNSRWMWSVSWFEASSLSGFHDVTISVYHVSLP